MTPEDRHHSLGISCSRRALLLGGAWFLLAGRFARAQEQPPFEVRVLLTRWQHSPVYVTSPSPWQARTARRTLRFAAGEQVRLEREEERWALCLGDERISEPEWTLEGAEGISLSAFADGELQRYRGRLWCRFHRGKGQVVNVLPLEEYLWGVVPREMPSRFPAEALKAQAIAARSWTVRNRGKHEAEGVDFCDTTHCQVYTGALAERESTTRAVQETAGLILVTADAPVDGVYTADCGGRPAPGNSPTPLPADRDDSGTDYCATNPRHLWTLRFPFSRVWRLAGGEDSPPEPSKGEVAAQIAQSDASGRVLSLRLRWGAQAVEVPGVRLRQALSLPSTLFEVRVEESLLVFDGRGAGHGSGLCQWGAAGRARAGQRVEEILRGYYPGAQIAPLSEAMWRWREARKANSAR